MNYRRSGNTDLLVSEIGFGAWAIGGPAVVGDIPIGWGEVNDAISKHAKYLIHYSLHFNKTTYGMCENPRLDMGWYLFHPRSFPPINTQYKKKSMIYGH